MAFRRTRRPAIPRVEPLRDSELEWRDNQIVVAEMLARRYGDSGSEGLPPVEVLDAIVAGWMADDDTRVEVNVLVNAVGVAFGAHLAVAGGLAWVIATDRAGSDLALHGQPGDIIVYPANLVAKRVTAGESAFIAPLLREMTDAIPRRRVQG